MTLTESNGKNKSGISYTMQYCYKWRYCFTLCN